MLSRVRKIRAAAARGRRVEYAATVPRGGHGAGVTACLVDRRPHVHASALNAPACSRCAQGIPHRSPESEQQLLARFRGDPASRSAEKFVFAILPLLESEETIVELVVHCCVRAGRFTP